MRFVLADGTEIMIEAEPAAPAVRDGNLRGPQPASRDVTVAGVQRSFEQALGAVKKTLTSAVHELRDAFPERPDELELEFGIKASLEANTLILAKAAGEASFTVKALWKKPVPPATAP
jgi:hypothetical protein